MKNKWLVSIAAITSLTIIASISIIHGADWQIIVTTIGIIGSIAGVTSGAVAITKKVRNARKN